MVWRLQSTFRSVVSVRVEEYGAGTLPTALGPAVLSAPIVTAALTATRPSAPLARRALAVAMALLLIAGVLSTAMSRTLAGTAES